MFTSKVDQNWQHGQRWKNPKTKKIRNKKIHPSKQRKETLRPFNPPVAYIPALKLKRERICFGKNPYLHKKYNIYIYTHSNKINSPESNIKAILHFPN